MKSANRRLFRNTPFLQKFILLVVYPAFGFASTNSNPTLSDCAASIFVNGQGSYQLQVDEALRRAGLDPAKAKTLNDSYAICVETGEACLSTGVDASRHVHAIDRQLFEVAKFIRDFHIDAEGRSPVPFGFNEVRILPGSRVSSRGKVAVEGNRLLLYVPQPGGIGYWPVSAHQIRRLWDAGKMHPWVSPLRSKWKYLNPVGSFQMAIRMNLRGSALSVAQKILGLIEKRKRGESVGTEVKSMVDNALLGDGALDRFERLATEEQVSVLEKWLSRMMEPELPQSLVEGAVTQALFDSEERDYRIRLRGLIAIGNVKDIGVKVRLGSVQYVRISSESPQTDVSVTGLLFALYLIDNVKVNLDFSKSMETASFAAAQND